MAKDNKITMPTSTAGLTRYFDDYKSKLSFRPQSIIILVIVVIIIEIILHSQGLRILGF
ncbi:preprotein translocase subunit Sec61beta [Candidatus Woesearchaeota archaeon]|nr:preprotein translocase subunit Sec61beta [Candidatus Woesearchaeota archaeon]